MADQSLPPSRETDVEVFDPEARVTVEISARLENDVREQMVDPTCSFEDALITIMGERCGWSDDEDEVL